MADVILWPDDDDATKARIVRDASLPVTLTAVAAGDYTAYVADGATVRVEAGIAPAAAGSLADLTLTQGVAMAPVDVSADFTGTAPITYALAPASEALPDGLSLSGAGILSGTPDTRSAAAIIVVRGTSPHGFADSGFSVSVETAIAPDTDAIAAAGDWTVSGSDHTGLVIASDPSIAVEANDSYSIVYTENNVADGNRTALAWATSADGITWTPIDGAGGFVVTADSAGGAHPPRIEGPSLWREGSTYYIWAGCYPDEGTPSSGFPADIWRFTLDASRTVAESALALARTTDGYDHDAAQSPSVLRDGDTWFMAYTGHNYTGADSNLHGVRVLGATSPDGETWTKHPTPLLEADSGRAWMSWGAAEPHIMPIGGLWYLFFTGLNDQERTIGYAISYAPMGPYTVIAEIVDETPNQAIAPFVLEENDGFTMWHLLFDGDNYVIRRRRSEAAAFPLYTSAGDAVFDIAENGATHIEIEVSEPAIYAGTYEVALSDLDDGPVNLVEPGFTGTAEEGETVTAVDGFWISRAGNLSVTREWVQGEDTVVGSGETHVITANDVIDGLTVVESATDDNGGPVEASGEVLEEGTLPALDNEQILAPVYFASPWNGGTKSYDVNLTGWGAGDLLVIGESGNVHTTNMNDFTCTVGGNAATRVLSTGSVRTRAAMFAYTLTEPGGPDTAITITNGDGDSTPIQGVTFAHVFRSAVVSDAATSSINSDATVHETGPITVPTTPNAVIAMGAAQHIHNISDLTATSPAETYEFTGSERRFTVGIARDVTPGDFTAAMDRTTDGSVRESTLQVIALEAAP